MMLLKLLFVVVLCAVTVSSFDMKAGEKVHKKMVFFKRVKTVALPLVKRIAFLSYSDPDNCVIKGIEVLDNDFSLATANITDGGVGFSHVTIRMKSQRSHPLNYQVEIYV